MMDNPALTLALALAAGMIGQAIAHHVKIPGIVILLAIGVLLGPDVVGLIQPSSLGQGLFMIVGFAVAVILFEGGMNLRIQRLKREGHVIRTLITLGAVISAVCGIFATRVFLDWNWRQAILFGTLIPVTGPTVIAPLLRRIRVKRSISTILEAEGILLDAIAAIVAAVALEIAIAPIEFFLALEGGFEIITRLLFGGAIGAATGYLLASLLRIRNLVPEGMENVFTLAIVFALYQVSDLIMSESGIVAVTIAGFVVGNSKTFVRRELSEFKEHLTVLLIGMLFILLAADVRIASVIALGRGGVMVVLFLIFIARPLSVFSSTLSSGMDLRSKVFLSWIGPRGIVAAAIASLFSYELESHGFDGSGLRAMVFLVIGVTVLQSGLTGGLVARVLNLRRKMDNGWVILGANELARTLARILSEKGEETICIDRNPKLVKKAEEDGTRVIYGNGLEESVFLRAEVDTRHGIIALTANQDLNMLFAGKVKELAKINRIVVSVQSDIDKTTLELVEEFDGGIFGGRAIDVESWIVKIRRGLVILEEWEYTGDDEDIDQPDILSDRSLANMILPLTTSRNEKTVPMDHKKRLKKGDRLMILVNRRNCPKCEQWLKDHNFILVEKIDAGKESRTTDNDNQKGTDSAQ